MDGIEEGQVVMFMAGSEGKLYKQKALIHGAKVKSNTVTRVIESIHVIAVGSLLK